MTPDIYTNQEHFIDVGDGHTLYVHDWGNKGATPIFVLHGGPGSSSKDKRKNMFDPTKQRVIFHDQRGCGRSTPLGSREHNTTQDLIADISKIADVLQIEKFILHGISWGSTLAFCYAIAEPERVLTIVTGGVFLGSQAEINWQDTGHVKLFYPDVWQAFIDKTPEEFRENAITYHQHKALNGSINEQKSSSYALELLEGGIALLDDRREPVDYETYDPSAIQIEIHYVSQNCFIEEDHILNNAGTLKMPIHIVQGRYDMVCPPETAYNLHNILPSSELFWVLEGHAPGHEGWSLFKSLLFSATKDFTK